MKSMAVYSAVLDTDVFMYGMYEGVDSVSQDYFLPPGWAFSTIGEVCESSQYGYTAKAVPSGEIHFLRTSDITSREINWNTVPFCEISRDEEEKYLLKDGDVVISRAGSVGFSCLILNPPKSVFASYLIRFRPLILPKYFSYFLMTPAYWESIDERSLGIAVQNVNATNLSEIQIPIAPKAEQIRIVEKLEELLSDLDAGVVELKAAQKKLVQYRQSLLKSAVEGELTAAWRTEQAKRGEHLETGSQLLDRILAKRRCLWEEKQLAKFKEQGKTPPQGWQGKYLEPVKPDTTNLPKLPEGWVWASLDMLGDIVSGVTKGTKRDSSVVVREVPYLRVANVQRGYLDLSEVKTIFATERNIEELTLQKGDVLFNEGGDRDKLGRGWVWQNEVDNCIHQNHVFRMRPYLSEVLPELVSHQGNTFGKTWFQSAGKQTTNLASINMTVLRAFPVPLAPVNEQQETLSILIESLAALDQQEKVVELGLKRSEAQRKNILKGAFSGQLTPKDPNDEPASVLLERISSDLLQRSTEKPKRTRKKTIGKAMTSKMTSNVVKETIRNFTTDKFSFDELRNAVGGNYDELKNIIFNLLTEESPSLKQEFDDSSKSIRFVRVLP